MNLKKVHGEQPKVSLPKFLLQVPIAQAGKIRLDKTQI
jgi:hypothetical protein